LPKSPSSDAGSIYPKSYRSDSNPRSSVSSSLGTDNGFPSKDQSSDPRKNESSKLSRVSETGYSADNSYAKDNMGFKRKSAYELQRTSCYEKKIEPLDELKVRSKKLESIQEISQQTLYNRSSDIHSMYESWKADHGVQEIKVRTNGVNSNIKKPITVYGKVIN
jgi:hypothetical protein